METSQPPTVVAIVRDLIFSSKITGAAKAVGATVRVIRDPALLGADPVKLLIIDLSLPGIIESTSDWRQKHAIPTVGFVSHVDTAAIAAARQAGITVLARSGFVEALPQLLQNANS
jgi:hypothetical protein